ncbi:ASCH domain-containing protein [Cohaesibacter sp. CAU 1516]|uniref:ASCH domain-containing protein n=1 Tax=Cohaesibacter sp. CAU 1516 TaxID=2576038 RepID=UPI0010FE97BD|nr:ASCH domain-containing protein [Cohaesibacter sp. CAU 1516]TLP48495.1 ASCH domain-containing protein [Cohaesibacter sp. CAU 1516]
MTKLTAATQAFFDAYLDTLSLQQREAMACRHVAADYFCADEVNANLCADLVLRDEKRASCGLAYWVDSGQERMPQVGDLLIVQNWNRNPVALVELIAVDRLPFRAIDADFAAAEGEGDKSYTWWRAVHWDFFAKEFEEIGGAMRDDVEIITERFRRLWPAA